MNQDQPLLAAQQADDVSVDLRELSLDEVLTVAGGPEVVNDRGV